MPVSIINYKGKEILFLDHKGVAENELINSIMAGTRAILESKSKEIIYIADFTDCFINKEVMEYLKSDENKEAVKKTRKSAVIGITGLKKIFLNAYNTFFKSNVKACKSLEEAKEFVIF